MSYKENELLAIFVPYFFSFVFVIMASTFFHDFFQKRKKASLSNCMAIEKVQTAYISRVNSVPLYPRSKHGLSKNTLIFQTFGTALILHFLYF